MYHTDIIQPVTNQVQAMVPSQIDHNAMPTSQAAGVTPPHPTPVATLPYEKSIFEKAHVLKSIRKLLCKTSPLKHCFAEAIPLTIPTEAACRN